MSVRKIKKRMNRLRPVAYTFSALVKRRNDTPWEQVIQTKWSRSGVPSFSVKLTGYVVAPAVYRGEVEIEQGFSIQ